jgi:secreted trypsin-like serine protease
VCQFPIVEALIGSNVRSATEKEFPFIVAIVKSYSQNVMDDDYICAGTLISKKNILTSAHCIEDQYTYGVTIRIGSSYVNQASIHYVQWWMTFQQWAEQTNYIIRFAKNDIAIISVIIFQLKVFFFHEQIYHTYCNNTMIFYNFYLLLIIFLYYIFIS